MAFAESAGVRIYYEVHGSGEPLVLLPGQAGDHTSWDWVREDYSARHSVIVLDYRGTGQSDHPTAPPYSTRLFAGDVVAVLDHLGIERSHAFGVSFGGRVAQWLGIEHSDRLGGLVLGCTTPGNAHGVHRSQAVLDFLDNPPADPQEALMKRLDLFITPRFRDANPEFVQDFVERRKRKSAPEIAELHEVASEGHDSWDRLPEVTAPVLVIHGSEDPMNVTANAPLLAGRIPGAELHLVLGARHMFYVERREEAARVILGFLAKHPVEMGGDVPSAPAPP